MIICEPLRVIGSYYQAIGPYRASRCRRLDELDRDEVELFGDDNEVEDEEDDD